MPFLRRGTTNSLPSRGGKKVTNTMKRSVSVPGCKAELIAVKSAMRVSSLDESLHKKGLAKNPQRPSGIEFHEIRIREYARALGDNPSCSAGPPVSIGWEYNPKEIHLKVEKYEDKRPERRTMQEMVLPRDVRFKMLTQEWQVSRKDCAEATRQSLKVKNQRRQTVRNMDKAPGVEEKMENVGKVFKRSLSFKKKTSSQVQDMMAAADKASAGVASMAAKEYEWEPEEVNKGDGSQGSASSRQESKTMIGDFDAGVGMNYDDQEHAVGDDGGDEPETSRPPRSSPQKVRAVRSPVKQSLNGSYRGKPIVISEDDCVA